MAEVEETLGKFDLRREENAPFSGRNRMDLRGQRVWIETLEPELAVPEPEIVCCLTGEKINLGSTAGPVNPASEMLGGSRAGIKCEQAKAPLEGISRENMAGYVRLFAKRHARYRMFVDRSEEKEESNKLC